MIDFTDEQKKNLCYFKAHINEFLQDDLLENKYVIIAEEKIKKSFDTLETAVDYAIDNLREGDYIIQQIVDETNDIGYVWSALNCNSL